jgi:hypothetical protein
VSILEGLRPDSTEILRIGMKSPHPGRDIEYHYPPAEGVSELVFEVFVDGQMRELTVGDFLTGKHEPPVRHLNAVHAAMRRGA